MYNTRISYCTFLKRRNIVRRSWRYLENCEPLKHTDVVQRRYCLVIRMLGCTCFNAVADIQLRRATCYTRLSSLDVFCPMSFNPHYNATADLIQRSGKILLNFPWGPFLQDKCLQERFAGSSVTWQIVDILELPSDSHQRSRWWVLLPTLSPKSLTWWWFSDFVAFIQAISVIWVEFLYAKLSVINMIFEEFWASIRSIKLLSHTKNHLVMNSYRLPKEFLICSLCLSDSPIPL